MPVISKNALVKYTALDMFNIVNDVESYPQFLPWCGSTDVIFRDADTVEATIEIAHSGISKTFTTRNRNQTGKMIEVQLVDGPFKHLHGYWRFAALTDEACKVSLDMEYEFSNKLLGLAVGPVFGQIANSLVDAFCVRAESLYGKKS